MFCQLSLAFRIDCAIWVLTVWFMIIEDTKKLMSNFRVFNRLSIFVMLHILVRWAKWLVAFTKVALANPVRNSMFAFFGFFGLKKMLHRRCMVTQGFSVNLLSPEKEQRNVPFLCMSFSSDLWLNCFEHSCLMGFAGEQKGCFCKEIVKKCNFCCQRFRLQKTN